MRRAFSAATIVAALALAVSACGGGDGGETAAPAQSAADPSKITGEITWWDTTRPDSEGPTFQALIKEFQAQYPGIKVKYVNVPFDQAQNQFQTAAQAGSGAPDVVRAEVAWTAQFASLGYLQPLEGTRAIEGAESDWLPGPLSSTKYDGKTWAVPQVTDSLALIYNKELLAKAGHETPPTTVEELKQVALDVKKETGVDGLALNVDAYFLLPFMYGEGGDLLDVANKKIVVNSPANVKALSTVADLVSSGAAGKPAIQDSYVNAMTAIKEGKAAMIFNGPWALSELYQGAEFKDKENLGIAPVPKGSVKAGAPTGGHNLAIYAGSKNLDASYEFVRFMTSTASLAKMSAELGLLPPRLSSFDDPAVQGNKDVAVFKPIMDTAVPRPWIPEGGQLFQPLLEGYQAMIGGRETPEAMLKTVDEKYRGIFKEWS